MAQQQVSMRKIKEILRQHYDLGLRQDQIARSCNIGQAYIAIWSGLPHTLYTRKKVSKLKKSFRQNSPFTEHEGSLQTTDETDIES